MAKILVVDDDPIIRLSLKRALERQGHEILLANDGQEGLEQATRSQPALIICDWMMPHLNGLEMCQRVKATPELVATFFILLTTRGAVEDRVQGLDSGADDFLSKPIEINELQARVRSGLRLHQLHQDLQQQKQLLETELSEAATYVKSLLPNSLDGKIEVQSQFIPSRMLGGDCFDFFWLDPDYLVIYLLDVSGHGLGAALPSIALLNLLRSKTLSELNFYQPSEVLRVLNESFQMTQHNQKYFTIWYGVYNHAKRQLSYASAGHPPAVLVSGTTPTAQPLKTANPPIGMLSDLTFTSARQTIPPSSTLYIFSDGIYDLDFSEANPDESQCQWGLEPLIELLTTQTNRSLDQIVASVQQSSQIAAFNDDLSLLKIRFPAAD